MFKATIATGFIATALGFTLFVFAGCADAVDSSDLTVVRNVTVFDATGSKPFQADVLIRDGRFSEIGKGITAPAGAKQIDGNGLSLLPGLIDVHMHWTTMGGVSRAEISTLLLQSGITTVTDFHSAPESFAPKRQWHTQLVSPHVVYTARTATPGGHGADWGDENITRLITSVRDGTESVADLAQYQPEVIKVFADGWRYGSGINNASINGNALAAVVAQAKQQQLPVVTHTVTVDGAKTAAGAGVTAIVHAIQDRKVDDELLKLMRDNNVFYAPTLAVYEPREDKTINSNEAQLQLVQYRQRVSRYNLQRIAKAGIPLALGTDSGIAATPFGESSLRELELLVDFGLSPAQAIIAGTANSAAVLGLKDDRGTIETGKRADFILVRGQPWKNISDYRKSEYVFVDGRLVAHEGKLTRQQGSALPPAVAALPLIDDFERQDDLTAGIASRLADVEYGFPRSQLISQRVPRSGGGHALLLSARLALKDSAKAFVVLQLAPGGFAAVDASAFKGFRFDVRGDSGSYATEIVTVAGSAQKPFSAKAEWQTIEILFSELAAETTGAGISPEAVFAVKFGAKRSAGERFWLELDNVSFF